MTLIEFYDKTPADNITAALALRPRRIVFLGQDRDKISAAMPQVRTILSQRGIKSALTMRVIRTGDLTGTMNALREVLAREDEFVFDITGGDDMALVALGLLFKLTDKKVSVFQMDGTTRQGTLYRLPFSGGTFEAVPYDGTGENPVYLTVRENIQLHRGQVREEMVGGNTAAGCPFTASVRENIRKMWGLCRTDCGLWNSQIGKLGAALRPITEDKSVYTLSKNLRGLEENFIASLTDTGLLQLQSGGGNSWHCTFPDLYVRDCLTKAGTLLEYKTYMTAMFPPEGCGVAPCSDGGAGVVIDWAEAKRDGGQKANNQQKKNGGRYGKKNYGGNGYRRGNPRPAAPITTRNEIDTLLTRGIVPMFVSCKNGEVSTDELYKLNTVAGRFGSRYARRVLVTTSYFDKEDRHYAGDTTANHLRSRAADMHIRLIENVHRMSDGEFAKALAKAWEDGSDK